MPYVQVTYNSIPVYYSLTLPVFVLESHTQVKNSTDILHDLFCINSNRYNLYKNKLYFWALNVIVHESRNKKFGFKDAFSSSVSQKRNLFR
jgi:hypothetical protein